MSGFENNSELSQAPAPLGLAQAIPGLMAFREKVGADTPKGRLATVIIEAIQRLPEWKPGSWFCDERQTPHYWIKKSLARLGG
jgi:hypothetical protein